MRTQHGFLVLIPSGCFVCVVLSWCARYWKFPKLNVGKRIELVFTIVTYRFWSSFCSLN